MASNAGGVGKNRIIYMYQYLASLRVVNCATVKMSYTAGVPDRGKLVTLIAGSNNRRRLLFAGDGRRSVYDKKPQRYAEDNRS